MSCLEQSVSQQVMTNLEKMFASFGESLIRKLSEKYSFDYEEGMRYVGLSDVKLKRTQVSKKQEKSEKSSEKSNKSEERLIPSIILPFCGKINESWCNGLRPNHDLYTQCTGIRMKSGSYCKTCQKQADSSSSGKPKYGTIQDRMEQGEDFEVGGKKPVNYGNVMEKEKISREAAEAEALKFGWTIPEDQFEKQAKAGRGRPKTEKSEKKKELKADGEEVEKKGRGRPKKEKKLVSNNKSGDDVIAALVAKAKASNAEVVSEECEALAAVVPGAAGASVIGVKSADNKNKSEETSDKKITKVVKKVNDKEAKAKADADAKAKADADAKAKADADAKANADAEAKAKAKSDELSEEDVESDSEVEVEVKKWVHNGKTYLKSTHNKVYDIKTQEVVGIWNANTDTIEEDPDNGSDEDSDE